MPKLPKNIGWSMGTELRESQYVLSAKNSVPVQRGMIFHVSLGAQPAPLSWLFSLPAVSSLGYRRCQHDKDSMTCQSFERGAEALSTGAL